MAEKQSVKICISIDTNTHNHFTKGKIKLGGKNSFITKAMFDRECKEFDDGTLLVSHDTYLGERYD